MNATCHSSRLETSQPRYRARSKRDFVDKRYTALLQKVGAADKQKIFEGNAFKVFSRLKQQIAKQAA